MKYCEEILKYGENEVVVDGNRMDRRQKEGEVERKNLLVMLTNGA